MPGAVVCPSLSALPPYAVVLIALSLPVEMPQRFRYLAHLTLYFEQCALDLVDPLRHQLVVQPDAQHRNACHWPANRHDVRQVLSISSSHVSRFTFHVSRPPTVPMSARFFPFPLLTFHVSRFTPPSRPDVHQVLPVSSSHASRFTFHAPQPWCTSALND